MTKDKKKLGCIAAIGAIVGLILILISIGCCLGNSESERVKANAEADERVKENPAPVIAQARAAIDRGDLANAKFEMVRLDRVGAAHDLDAAYKAKEDEMRLDLLAQRDADRLEGIAAALASRGCDTWADDWSKLRKIKAAEVTPEAQEVTDRLEQCRLKSIRDTSQKVAGVAVELRKGIKPELDKAFLAGGLDVAIKTMGTDHTTIRMTNALFNNRVMATRYADAGLIRVLEQSGFKKAIFTDGSFTYTYTLEPEELDPKAMTLKELAKRGMHIPLALPTE